MAIKKISFCTNDFDPITMMGIGILEGNVVIMSKTYCFGPVAHYYDETNRKWVESWYKVEYLTNSLRSIPYYIPLIEQAQKEFSSMEFFESKRKEESNH